MSLKRFLITTELQQKVTRLSPVLSVVGSIIYIFIKNFFLLRFKRKMLFLTRNKRQKKKTYPKRYILRLHLIKLSALFTTLVASMSDLSTDTTVLKLQLSFPYCPLYRAVYIFARWKH